MSVKMLLFLRRSFECAVADFANVWTFPSMHAHVLSQMTGLPEFLVALGARERFFIGVNAKMFLQGV